MDASRLTVAVGAVLAFVGGPTPTDAQGLPPADTVWRYTAPSEITGIRECADAELLLGTKKALIAIDATTGDELWAREDLPNIGPGLSWGRCGATTGFSYRKDKLLAIDLLSGRPLWDQDALPASQEIRGYFRMDEDDLLLLFLRTTASDRTLLAVQLSTGAVRWRRDDLFAQPPKFAGSGGVSDIAEYQPLYRDSDTTLLVYFSADGLQRIDARTGATLWSGGALAGRRVPTVGDYAAMTLLDTILVIPRDKGLVAIDVRDGTLRWETGEFPVRPTRLVPVPAGLLVRSGPASLTVLDPATGVPRWAAPLTVHTDGVAYEVLEDRYYVVSGDRLLVADLETGDTTALATLAFDGGEHARNMYATDDRLLVAARQNLFVFDLAGTLQYHRYFKAPGASFLEKVGGALSGHFDMFGARLGAAAFGSEYAYFMTDEPDASGQTGYSVVRVAMDDGREAGRIWFDEKAPWFQPDTARDQLLFLKNDRTLVALRFPVHGR